MTQSCKKVANGSTISNNNVNTQYEPMLTCDSHSVKTNVAPIKLWVAMWSSKPNPKHLPTIAAMDKKSSFPLFDNNTTCKIACASAIIVYNIMAFQLVLCFLPLRASPFLEVFAFLLIQCLMMAWNQWQTECLLCCNRQYQLMIWPLHKLY